VNQHLDDLIQMALQGSEPQKRAQLIPSDRAELVELEIAAAALHQVWAKPVDVALPLHFASLAQQALNRFLQSLDSDLPHPPNH
jgi:hypothetical protein